MGREPGLPELAPTSAGRPLLLASHLVCGYGSSTVVRDVSLALNPRECLAVVGESGSGKTTLTQALAGLRPPARGVVELAGHVLEGHSRDRAHADRQAIQYVFQNPYGSLNPRKSVEEIVGRPVRTFHQLKGPAAREAVLKALDRVSLPRRVVDLYPDQLSGGERQRVAIARALAAEPTVLICDEITSALDVSIQAAIGQLLRGLIDEQGLSLLFVTHDIALVRALAERVMVMLDGAIVEEGTTSSVLDRPQHDYTRALIAATPSV